MEDWIKVEDEKPYYNIREGSLGTEVFIKGDKDYGNDGKAFYGCRISKNPCFYLYGEMVKGVTHWKPIK